MHDTATPTIKKAPARTRVDRTSLDVEGIVVRFRPGVLWTDKELFGFCRQNKELRIEQTARGEIIIMPPVGWQSGQRNFNLYGPFLAWAEQAARGGRFTDSSAGFKLPNGAMRSPDLAWVTDERLDQLPKRQWKKFLPLCPDFVVELRSETDRLPRLKAKMAEYLTNGARLGWLLDPPSKQVFVYRPGEKPERLENPATLSGEPVLAGFTLDLARVW